jgi:hypothetical protein
VGCNRDKIAQELPQPRETAAQAQTNQELAAVAQALARTLGTDAAARQQLKAEALKKIDGDYDVLYQPFAAGHAAFGQHMAEAVGGTGPAGLTMPALVSRIPTLNLLVPVNIDKWDAATYAPLVIFIPAGYDERTATRVKAYDQNGNAQWLDAKKAPSFPVVVVGPSERVPSDVALTAAKPAREENSLKPQGVATSSMVDEPNTQLEMPADGNSGGGYAPLGTSGTTGTAGTTATACRVDKQIEYLREIYMKDVSEYESWFLGAPEIRLQIMSPLGTNGSSILEVMYTMSRGAIEDHWYCNTQLYYWNKATITDTVGYLWVEQDGGDEIDVKLTLGYKTDKGLNASTEITYKIKNDDDQICKIPMDFDFCPSEGYYTGGTSGSREFHWVLENRP